jgi:hypothetical protein
MSEPLTILEKQPWEELDFDFDMTSKTDGADLASITSLTIVGVGTVGSAPVTASNETLSGAIMRARYAGGSHGEKWLVTFRGVDVNGQKVETEGYLVVKERPTP